MFDDPSYEREFHENQWKAILELARYYKRMAFTVCDSVNARKGLLAVAEETCLKEYPAFKFEIRIAFCF